MNILFISPIFSGGIGGHASMLADQLSNYGYEVKKMQAPHIPIKNLKNPSFALFSSLSSLVNRESFDIVHGYLFQHMLLDFQFLKYQTCQ